ncbi:MAG: CRISPR-associated helicase Cas3' [Elusimicrobiota bacterium]|jgi:CRISPR-associated endonuclease/helicase Cas3|nr:CRISPR-associated helicase Cas3' [Elusimicrobiota bacterium]
MIKSHKNPDKPLWGKYGDNGHLEDVYCGIKNILLDLNLNEEFLSKEKIDLYSKIIGYCHDIGKVTTFFQKKLELDNPKNEPLSNHSKIGALFSYYIMDLLKIDEDIKFLIYRLIYCHHKSFHENLEDLIIGGDASKNIKTQIEDILKNCESNKILENVLKIFGIYKFEKESFLNNVGKINKSIILKSIILKSLNSLNEKNIILYFILYSAFSKADKYGALFRGNFSVNIETRKKLSKNISDNIVDNYKAAILKAENIYKFKDSNLNKLREEFYNDIKNSIKNLNLKKDKIFQVIAPTGIGKTMTILNAAINLKNRLFKEEGKIYRIIYSLPFISIIDQISIIIKDIFEKNNIKIDQDLFLEYHHLSDITNRKSKEYDNEKNIDIHENESEENLEENIMFNNFWESEIILTTFVSFLEVFASGKDLLKLTNIANSIIILDEIQSINIGLYKYINWFSKILTKYFNCYIVLMTATMPKIFDIGEYKNLYFSDKLEKKLYSKSNRYLIKYLGKKKIDEFIIYLKDYLLKNFNESVLVISNTKKMAYKISREIIDGKNVMNESELIHLTTVTIPLLRKKFIESIKSDEDKKRKIIISTQLIEAGVDISVNTVFKFLSPYESIIQASGRANRNYEFGELGGKSFVVDIFDEREKPSYKSVYIVNTEKTGGDIKINSTKDIFKEFTIIEESNLLPISKKYFDAIKLDSYWDEIEEYLIEWKLFDFGKKIRIIDENIKKYTVFVDIEIENKDGEKIKSSDVYGKYLDIKNRNITNKDDFFRIKNKLKELQSEFSQFCVNITEKEAENLLELGNLKDNKIIPKLNKDSYDLKLGLKIFDCQNNIFDV